MHVIINLLDYLSAGYKVHVIGGTAQMIALIEGAKSLMENKRTSVPELAAFRNWDELVAHSESDSGSDLSVLVNLLKKFDPDELIKALRRTEYFEQNAHVVLSTCHKIKGKEAISVQLDNDFRDTEHQYYTQEDSNLLYVAATRAINQLDINRCAAVGL